MPDGTYLTLNPGGPNESRLFFPAAPDASGFLHVEVRNTADQLVGVAKFSGRNNGDCAVEVLPTTGHPIDCYVGTVDGAEAYRGTA